MPRVGDIAGMGTIVLLLLLGWLACTAVLTIGVGSRERATERDSDLRSATGQQLTQSNGRVKNSPRPQVVVGSTQESSGAHAGID
jgi:hypothetical protein